MVTTTTKTINYSISKGNHVNSVNATIVSTPGCNCSYLGRPSGILKVVELVLVLIALALVLSAVKHDQPIRPGGHYYPVRDYNGNNEWYSWRREHLMVGETGFVAAQTAALLLLFILLVSYLSSTTSAMIVPKTTNLEKVANITLAVLLIAAGVVQIVVACLWQRDEYQRSILENFEIRVAAGAISILNGIVFIVSAVFAAKELAGPKTL